MGCSININSCSKRQLLTSFVVEVGLEEIVACSRTHLVEITTIWEV